MHAVLSKVKTNHILLGSLTFSLPYTWNKYKIITTAELYKDVGLERTLTEFDAKRNQLTNAFFIFKNNDWSFVKIIPFYDLDNCLPLRGWRGDANDDAGAQLCIYETSVHAGLFYILRPGQRLGHCCRNQVTFLLILLKIYIYFKILCLLNRSTGLTCSLALSQYVSERLSKQLYLGFFNFRAF